MINKKIPMRKCTGCGEMKPKKQLIRIIRTPQDTVMTDATGKKNGRGAYLCNSSECLAKAVKSRGLERSLGCAIPKELYEQLKKELNQLEQTDNG